MQIVIDIPEQDYVYIAKKHCFPSCDDRTLRKKFYEMVVNGTPLPKGHGRLVDIGKIDEDRIDSDNPVIYLTINGEYIEAVSLDYLNSLSTIIEADKRSEDKG